MNLTFNFIYSLIRDLDAKIFGSRSNGCVAEVPVLEGFMITLREGMEAFLRYHSRSLLAERAQAASSIQ